MIRFSARGAYLLLVPQGRALFLCCETTECSKETLTFILKRTLTETVTVTNTDGECSVNVRDLP